MADRTTTTDAGTTNADLRRLKDLDDYEVADGYPDIRGWEVKTADGRTLGKVDDLIVSLSEMRVRYLDVDVDRSLRSAIADAARPAGDEPGHALVPIGTARLDDDADDVVVSGLAGAELESYPRYARAGGVTREYESSLRDRFGTGAAGAAAGDHEHFDDSRLFSGARGRGASPAMQAGEEQRIVLHEEQLAVGTRAVQTGEVGVRKEVETERVREEVPLVREQVEVERRPLAADAAGIEIGGDQEIRVPVMREEAVVEKRAVVKEEIVVRKRARTDTQTVQADLRTEHLDVERNVAAAGRTSGAPATGDALAEKVRTAAEEARERLGDDAVDRR